MDAISLLEAFCPARTGARASSARAATALSGSISPDRKMEPATIHFNNFKLSSPFSMIERQAVIVSALLLLGVLLHTRQWSHNDDCSSNVPSASAESGDTIVLFVGVLSKSSNVQHREMIRSTWGRRNDLYRVVFHVCRPENASHFSSLREEAALKRDIVVVSHVLENYYSISHQTFEIYRTALMDGKATHVMKVQPIYCPVWMCV